MDSPLLTRLCRIGLPVLVTLVALALPAGASAVSCNPERDDPVNDVAPNTVVAPNLRVLHTNSGFGTGPTACAPAIQVAARSPDGTIWGTDTSNGLWKSTDDLVTWTLTWSVPDSDSQVVRVLPLASGRLLVMVRESLTTELMHVYQSTDATGTDFSATSLLDLPGCKPGASGPCTGRTLSNQSWVQVGNAVYLAEYGDPAPPLLLWKATVNPDQSVSAFQVVNQFPDIRHIHAVQADPYVAGRIWIVTGDVTDTGPGHPPHLENWIGYSDDGGLSFTRISDNIYPQSRAVGLIFRPDAVYWGSDTPNAVTGVFRWDRQTGRITRLLSNQPLPLYFTVQWVNPQNVQFSAQFTGIEGPASQYDQTHRVLTAMNDGPWTITKTPWTRTTGDNSEANSVITNTTDPDAQGRFWVSFFNLTGSEFRVTNVWLKFDPTATLPGSPHADFTVAPGRPVPGTPATFDGSASTGGGGVTYDWTFGDGTSGTGATPAHAYASEGVYTVNLQVTDAVGNTTQTTQDVTVSPPPVVDTQAADGLDTDRATLHGSANPKGLATTAHFEYGKTPLYGSVTPDVDVGSSSTAQALAHTLTGLEPNTTYYARLVAGNAQGTTAGPGVTFSTRFLAPAVTIRPADRRRAASSRLNGHVDPRGGPTTWWFEYGRTAAYGKSTSHLSAGTTAADVSRIITGLRPSTGYHARLVAENSTGIARSADIDLRTADAPFARLVLRRVRIAGGRVLGLKITCPAPGTTRCRGRVTVKVGRSSRVRRGPLAAGKTLATLSFSLRRGASLSPRPRVKRAARRAIKGQLPLTVSLRAQ